MTINLCGIHGELIPVNVQSKTFLIFGLEIKKLTNCGVMQNLIYLIRYMYTYTLI